MEVNVLPKYKWTALAASVYLSLSLSFFLFYYILSFPLTFTVLSFNHFFFQCISAKLQLRKNEAFTWDRNAMGFFHMEIVVTYFLK